MHGILGCTRINGVSIVSVIFAGYTAVTNTHRYTDTYTQTHRHTHTHTKPRYVRTSLATAII